MPAELARRRTPEEEELEKKLADLAQLENELSERELALATLQAELHSFERKYMEQVGVRYARLDDLEAQIAELLAQRDPADETASETARQSRRRAEESRQSADANRGDANKPDFRANEELKRLFRQVAKKVHPDLATDDADRARRQQAMAHANLAFEQQDEHRLRQILREWEDSPEAVKGEGVAEKLVRAIRKIAQVRQRFFAIDAEMAAIRKSELFTLKDKVLAASNAGRDLLAEMAENLDVKIQQAEKRLLDLSKKAPT